MSPASFFLEALFQSHNNKQMLWECSVGAPILSPAPMYSLLHMFGLLGGTALVLLVSIDWLGLDNAHLQVGIIQDRLPPVFSSPSQHTGASLGSNLQYLFCVPGLSGLHARRHRGLPP